MIVFLMLSLKNEQGSQQLIFEDTNQKGTLSTTDKGQERGGASKHSIDTRLLLASELYYNSSLRQPFRWPMTALGSCSHQSHATIRLFLPRKSLNSSRREMSALFGPNDYCTRTVHHGSWAGLSGSSDCQGSKLSHQTVYRMAFIHGEHNREETTAVRKWVALWSLGFGEEHSAVKQT